LLIVFTLALASPTEKCTSSALHNALYRRGAALAGFTLAAIDVEAVLEIAKLAIGITKIAQATSASFNSVC